MRPYNINLKKLLTPEDYALLQDKNRSTPGKSKIVPRVKELAIQAKTDIEKRNYLFYMVLPFYNYILKSFLHVSSNHFGEYYAECFEIFCDTVTAYNPEKSNNFLHLVKLNFRQTYINIWKSKKHRQDEITSHLDSMEPLIAEKYLKSFDNEFELPETNSRHNREEKKGIREKN